MTQMTKGNHQILEAERILTAIHFPANSLADIAHAQAMLTLALVREQRVANVIAWSSQPGWNPSHHTEQTIRDHLGLSVAGDTDIL